MRQLQRVGLDFGDAEVEQFDGDLAILVPSKKEIRGLDVAVDDVRRMRYHEPLKRLGYNA
jgi:hypothetical protein